VLKLRDLYGDLKKYKIRMGESFPRRWFGLIRQNAGRDGPAPGHRKLQITST
jgi:hypothetical protein